jgi:hypothetical protein
MLAPWASEEVQTVDLGDQRLNRRLKLLLSAFGERPTASIPAACGGHAELTAAYRFCDNDKVTWQAVLQPHYDKTVARAAQQPIVLLTQDTTELDLTRPQQQVEGAGPLACDTRRGVFAHPLTIFTPDGTPLGAAWVDMWSRPEDNRTPEEKKQWQREAPIEEKESYRWLQGLRQARAVAQELPQTTCVCLADSESDIYEVFAEPRGERPVHWLIRAAHADRSTLATAESPEKAAVQQLRDRVLAASPLLTKEISVRGRQAKVSCDKRGRRQPRQSRKAQVEVRATTVSLKPPYRPDRRLPPVTINAVLVSEIDPPAGDEPVEWLLLTTLPIDTPEQVQEITQYYAARFLIEVFFRILKSGCRVEERRFEELDRLLPCVAIYLIVAWRTFMLCRLGRSSPDLDCEAVFEPSEWKAVWTLVQRQPLPAQPPRLADMLKLIAQLGGYVNRPGRKDPPGPQTLWIGLQRMYDMAWAWNAFGPGAASATPAEDV